AKTQSSHGKIQARRRIRARDAQEPSVAGLAPGKSRMNRIAAGLATSLLATAALAQSYPAKPIRLIVPFAAGGGNDNVARLVGKHLSESLGQPLVIDNRPGAGGALGAEVAARAVPDGYTLFLGGAGRHAVTTNLNDSLPYDPTRDIAHVARRAPAPRLPE